MAWWRGNARAKCFGEPRSRLLQHIRPRWHVVIGGRYRPAWLGGFIGDGSAGRRPGLLVRERGSPPPTYRRRLRCYVCTQLPGTLRNIVGHASVSCRVHLLSAQQNRCLLPRHIELLAEWVGVPGTAGAVGCMQPALEASDCRPLQGSCKWPWCSKHPYCQAALAQTLRRNAVASTSARPECRSQPWRLVGLRIQALAAGSKTSKNKRR